MLNAVVLAILSSLPFTQNELLAAFNDRFSARNTVNEHIYRLQLGAIDASEGQKESFIRLVGLFFIRAV